MSIDPELACSESSSIKGKPGSVNIWSLRAEAKRGRRTPN